MKHTPLYEEHLRLGAKMVGFAGWEMPILYTGISQEVLAVRNGAGIFDVSHMGKLRVTGAHADELLQFVTTNDISRLHAEDAQYTLMCDENGGVVDDLIVYRPDAESYLLVVNASNTESDLAWITGHNRWRASVEDLADRYSIVALQGPKSTEILGRLAEFAPGDLPRFHMSKTIAVGAECLVARTGYTGEDGFEILVRPEDSPRLWRSLIQEGAVPAGLGARDVLRIEAGYPLYGRELDRDTTPVEARLMWAVKLGKGDFLGREPIARRLDMGPRRLLVGLEAEARCVPRNGYGVLAGAEGIGSVTSGTFSPTLGKGIALAYVRPGFAAIGTEVAVRVRESLCPFHVVKTPFYTSASLAKPRTPR